MCCGRSNFLLFIEVGFKNLDFSSHGCIVQKEFRHTFQPHPIRSPVGGRMTPVSSPSSPETDTAASPFYQLLQQSPLECHEKERFMESEVIGVQIYPEKGFLV